MSQSLNALPSGTVLHDYIIESELGSGGFSMVYLARHRLNTDWLFAIKEYLPRDLAIRDNDGASVHAVNTEAEDAFEDGRRRFRDEAEQLRRFRNERHVVSCLNYFEANGTAYLVMDYDDGLPLSEFLRQREEAGQPFTEADLRAVVEPLVEGLEVVHRAGVLHRDIKPGNVFVRRPDDIAGRPAQPVLIDFGAAKQNYLERHSRSRAPYTPGYAAYEQISSEGDIGPWTDIYAIGALMWRMVAGGCPGAPRLLKTDEAGGERAWNPTPRAAEKRAYALHRGRPDPMAPATELGSGRHSPQLLKAIDRCLALYPEDRVQDCEELRNLLDTLRTPSSLLSDQDANSPAARPRRAIDLPAKQDGDASDSLNERASEGARTRSAHQVGLGAPLLTGRRVAYWSCATLLLASVAWYILSAKQSQPSTPNSADVTSESIESVPDNSAQLDEILFELGVMSYEGDGVPEDKAEAAALFRQAAELGHARAQYTLGVMSNQGDGVPEDKVQAALWFTLSAEQGYAPSQSRLGERYFYGEGVPQDYAQAVVWYARAAEQDDAFGQYRLSSMYYNGTGVAKNDNQGFLWLTRAYEQGYSLAAPDLMIRYADNIFGFPDNTVQAVQWFHSRGEQGDSFAQHLLGKIYADGMNVPENDAQAAQWYARSAEQGYAPSQYQLGDMYYNGEGVPQNYAQAIRWYARAAEQGIPGAQISLGRMYANGEGVPLDNVQAYAWTNLASANGPPNAVALRDEIGRRLSETQIAQAQQLSLELDARIQSSR